MMVFIDAFIETVFFSQYQNCVYEIVIYYEVISNLILSKKSIDPKMMFMLITLIIFQIKTTLTNISSKNTHRTLVQHCTTTFCARPPVHDRCSCNSAINTVHH